MKFEKPKVGVSVLLHSSAPPDSFVSADRHIHEATTLGLGLDLVELSDPDRRFVLSKRYEALLAQVEVEAGDLYRNGIGMAARKGQLIDMILKRETCTLALCGNSLSGGRHQQDSERCDTRPHRR